MKNFSLLWIAGMVLIMSGCSPSHDKQVARITELEKRLFSPEAVSFDKTKADSLIEMYDLFVQKFPKDTLSPGYLFRAANVAMNMENSGKSLALFDQYIQQYPDQPKTPMCLFFKAFIYENQTRDLDKARETYLLFIEKYPAHEFAEQSQLALKNLGKTPEMLVKEFEDQRRADSLRVADSLKSASKGKHRR